MTACKTFETYERSSFSAVFNEWNNDAMTGVAYFGV